jgi:hypothetical protein
MSLPNSWTLYRYNHYISYRELTLPSLRTPIGDGLTIVSACGVQEMRLRSVLICKFKFDFFDMFAVVSNQSSWIHLNVLSNQLEEWL